MEAVLSVISIRKPVYYIMINSICVVNRLKSRFFSGTILVTVLQQVYLASDEPLSLH